MKPSKQGFITYKGFNVYYEIYGPATAKKTPLLVLHGGPGSAHNYLLGLAKLAENDRQVIFYDQLGGGKSDMPDDDSLWTFETFVQEIEQVRKELKLKSVHLLGHSWGGMLAIEYLLTKPGGVQSAVLASAMISMPLYNQEVEKLKRELPGDTYALMKQHEAAGTLHTEEYKKAYDVYHKHHLFRGDVFPAAYGMAGGKVGDAVYNKMWGANEAFAYGSLKKWDRIDDLTKIKAPTLITSGQYDELTPWQAGITANQIPNSELRIFTNGSHLVHIEQEAGYLSIVEGFLQAHDPGVTKPPEPRFFVA